MILVNIECFNFVDVVPVGSPPNIRDDRTTVNSIFADMLTLCCCLRCGVA